ncbi:hypothetical protein FACS1894211_10130 [Clostridia bacterium]|nr:hypothetical protein FACS1894211_10130 [Clostridia bacterium]
MTYAEKRDNIRRARAAGFNAEQTAQYVFPALDAKLDVLGRAVDIPPTDAKLFFYPFNNAQCTTHNAQLKVNSKFVIEREKEGYRIDRKRFYADLLRAFLKSPAPSVGLKFEPVPAPVSAKALREFACFKSAFVTSFSGSGAERRENIRRSAASFNGRRLEPGEEFSFNKSTGPRTEERGYQEAKIILNGRFEKGSGGGVCQTSTTLYNAALLAGMQIVEAHRHSLPVSYVAPSFDAAVSGGAMDLRFANPGPGPVFIRSDFLEDTLRVELYGVKNPYRIERRSEKLQELTDYEDEFLVDTEGKYRDVAPYRGERVRVTYPKAGLVSKGYLRYYAGRKLVREVCVRNDRYAPQNGLTVEGTLERPAPPPEPAPPALLLPEIRKYDIMNPWGAYSLYSALSNSR